MKNLKKSLKNKLKKRKTLRRRKRRYNGGAAAGVNFYALTREEQDDIIEKQKEEAERILTPYSDNKKIDFALRIVNYILTPNPNMYQIATRIVPFMEDPQFIKDCDSIIGNPNGLFTVQRRTLISLINERDMNILAGKHKLPIY